MQNGQPVFLASLPSLALCFQPRSIPFVWLLACTWICKNTDCFAVYCLLLAESCLWNLQFYLTYCILFPCVFFSPIQNGRRLSSSPRPPPPFAKKFNNFKAVQTRTTKLSESSWNWSGNILKSSRRVHQHWCYHGNRVFTAIFFKICFFSIFTDWITLHLV